MEIIVFTVVGIALYVLSDQLLSAFEKLHGEPLPQRNIVFFVLILVLSVSAFSLLRNFFSTGEGAQNDYEEQQAADGRDESTETH